MGTPVHFSEDGMEIVAAGESIDGISVTNKTFDSDNVTVAKEKLLYHPEPNLNNLYECDIIG
jgi:hypothetical protein